MDASADARIKALEEKVQSKVVPVLGELVPETIAVIFVESIGVNHLAMCWLSLKWKSDVLLSLPKTSSAHHHPLPVADRGSRES
jgi:hypothetical protein